MKTPWFVLWLSTAFLTAAGAAESVAGTWSATVDTPQGPFSFTLVLAFDKAGALTGSMLNEFIGSAPLKDGTTDGTKVFFKVSLPGGGDGPLTISYVGVVKGDELVLTSTIVGAAGGSQTFTAKRASFQPYVAP